MKKTAIMPWFRLYHEWADDPKVQILPEEMQRRHVMLMAMRAKGHAPCSDREVAHAMRISLDEWLETKAEFMAGDRELCNEDNDIPRWEERQAASDSSKDRTRRYRLRKQHTTDVTVCDASHHRHGDVTVTACDASHSRHCDGREERREEKKRGGSSRAGGRAQAGARIHDGTATPKEQTPPVEISEKAKEAEEIREQFEETYRKRTGKALAWSSWDHGQLVSLVDQLGAQEVRARVVHFAIGLEMPEGSRPWWADSPAWRNFHRNVNELAERPQPKRAKSRPQDAGRGVLDRVLAEVRRVGSQHAPDRLTAEERQAIRAIGGWTKVCQWPERDADGLRRQLVAAMGEVVTG